MGKSDQPLWKALYTQALSESDRQKVTLLLLAAGLAMIERSRQLLDSPEHHEERTELAVAKAALETIRFRKLASGCTKLIFTSDGCRSYLAILLGDSEPATQRATNNALRSTERPPRLHAFCENEPLLEQLTFIGFRLKVRTCTVLELSALSKFREMASSNSQEQEPDNNY